MVGVGYMIYRIFNPNAPSIFAKIRKSINSSKLQSLDKEIRAVYGSPSAEFEWRISDGNVYSIIAFESAHTFFIRRFNIDSLNIRQNQFDFSELIDFEIITEPETIKTVTTKLDGREMIRRGIIGGLLFGEIGAIFGALTTNKPPVVSKQVYENYAILLNLSSTNMPKIILPFYQSWSNLQEARCLLNYIIDHSRTQS